MKYKILFVLLLLAAFSASVFSQEYENGKPSDLKGLTKIFINTGTNLKDRQRIIEQIEKAKLEVTFLDTDDGAEIVMFFQGKTVVEGVPTGPYGMTITRVRLDTGSGMVFVQGKTKPRLVLSVTNSQQSKLEKRPVTKFVKEFIKEWKKANGIAE
jgi:hypothetical protein